MRSETTRLGEVAKCMVLCRCYEKGATASIPTIDTDYDLIIEWKGKLWRVQVKYGGGKVTNASGSSIVNLRRSTRTGSLTYSKNDIDAMAIFLPRGKTVVWLPPSVWEGKTSLTIRHDKAKNNQAKGVILAEDYAW